MKWFYVKLDKREHQRNFRALVTSYIIMRTPSIKFYKLKANHMTADYYINIPNVLFKDFKSFMKDFDLTEVDEPDIDNCILISGGYSFDNN